VFSDQVPPEKLIVVLLLVDCLEGWDEESDVKSATLFLQYPLLNYGRILRFVG
jgi:hypothetical protein